MEINSVENTLDFDDFPDFPDWESPEFRIEDEVTHECIRRVFHSFDDESEEESHQGDHSYHSFNHPNGKNQKIPSVALNCLFVARF